jgi:hypothetical protein
MLFPVTVPLNAQTETIQTDVEQPDMPQSINIQQDLHPILQIRETRDGKRLDRTDGRTFLPGAPRVDMRFAGLIQYLRSALLVPELDRLAPYLPLVRLPKLVTTVS